MILQVARNALLRLQSILTVNVFLCLFAPMASAEERLALVVGIDNYENVPSLQKANNDAIAISATLKGLGFDVTQVLDPDRRTLSRAISSFAADIKPGDEVTFYFAGHGIEVKGRNHLLPADVPSANPGDEEFVISESIAADRVLSVFKGQGARVTLLILDACRNNPFPSEGQRSLGGTRGLARMDPPEGSFILFSAGTGQTALDRLSNDDQNPNSVFTRALLPRLREPGMRLHDLAREVRSDVRKLAATVSHDQFPAYYDQLAGDFSFNPSDPSPVEPTNLPNQQGNATKPSDTCDAARADWQVLSSTRSSAALREFISTYENCQIYIAAARERLGSITSTTEESSTLATRPIAPTGGDTCERLWYDRNLIFHNKGYCFQSSRAKAVFDTSQCSGRSPSLSSAEKREVARIKAAEQANGC